MMPSDSKQHIKFSIILLSHGSCGGGCELYSSEVALFTMTKSLCIVSFVQCELAMDYSNNP